MEERVIQRFTSVHRLLQYIENVRTLYHCQTTNFGLSHIDKVISDMVKMGASSSIPLKESIEAKGEIACYGQFLLFQNLYGSYFGYLFEKSKSHVLRTIVVSLCTKNHFFRESVSLSDSVDPRSDCMFCAI